MPLTVATAICKASLRLFGQRRNIEQAGGEQLGIRFQCKNRNFTTARIGSVHASAARRKPGHLRGNGARWFFGTLVRLYPNSRNRP